MYSILKFFLIFLGLFNISVARAMDDSEQFGESTQSSIQSFAAACKKRGFSLIDEPTKKKNKIIIEIMKFEEERREEIAKRKQKLENDFNQAVAENMLLIEIVSRSMNNAYLSTSPKELGDLIEEGIQGTDESDGWMRTNCETFATNMRWPLLKFLYLSERIEADKEAYECGLNKLEQRLSIAAAELETFMGEGEKPKLRTHFFSLSVYLNDLSAYSPKEECIASIKKDIMSTIESILKNSYASEEDRDFAKNVRNHLNF